MSPLTKVLLNGMFCSLIICPPVCIYCQNHCKVLLIMQLGSMLKKTLENVYACSIFWNILANEGFFPRSHDVISNTHCWFPIQPSFLFPLSSQNGDTSSQNVTRKGELMPRSRGISLSLSLRGGRIWDSSPKEHVAMFQTFLVIILKKGQYGI